MAACEIVQNWVGLGKCSHGLLLVVISNLVLGFVCLLQITPLILFNFQVSILPCGILDLKDLKIGRFEAQVMP